MQAPVTIPPEQLARLCHQYGIARVWLFGSAATGTITPISDIDVLVEEHAGCPIGLFKLGALQMDLTDLLGRFVHLTTLGSIPASSRQQLLSSARLQYAA